MAERKGNSVLQRKRWEPMEERPESRDGFGDLGGRCCWLLYPFAPSVDKRAVGSSIFSLFTACQRTHVPAPSTELGGFVSHGSRAHSYHSHVINFLDHPFTASGVLKLASAQYRAAITRTLNRTTLIIPPTSCSILLQSFMDSLGPLLLLRLRTTGHRLFHPFGLYVTVSSSLPHAE